VNPKEYEIMNELEEKHWWYHGLRGYLTAVFNQFKNEIPK
ncbi:uncharacterized protein METZ01_LOCUS224344, partial [marine metagenome]